MYYFFINPTRFCGFTVSVINSLPLFLYCIERCEDSPNSGMLKSYENCIKRSKDPCLPKFPDKVVNAGNCW